MSRTFLLGTGLVGLLLALAILVLPAAPADAGRWIPIQDDDIILYVRVQDSTYCALPGNEQQLEQTYGVSSTSATLGDVLQGTAAATSANEFVMHDCEAAGNAASTLQSLGYGTKTVVPSSFPGATDDAVYTD